MPSGRGLIGNAIVEKRAVQDAKADAHSIDARPVLANFSVCAASARLNGCWLTHRLRGALLPGRAPSVITEAAGAVHAAAFADPVAH